jgi:hypothetical protein
MFMERIWLARTALLIVATLGLPQLARSQNRTLDDFSTGPYSKQLTAGQDRATQAGAMEGGERLTVFLVCDTGPCGPANPFSQVGSFEVRPANDPSPSALIYSAGYKAYPRLEMHYGAVTPLRLDLGTNYDRIRVNFDGSDGVVNFNIVVFSPSGYSQIGCNLEPIASSVSIDFPFANFQGQADPTKIDVISFVFQSGTAVGANDWAITSFEAVPTGAPAAPITCSGV